MVDANRSQARLRLAGLGGRTFIVLAALILLVAAADRVNWRFDGSPDRRFTLDPALDRILTSQAAPVELVAIWGRDAGGGDGAYLKALEDALRTMAGRNSSQITLKRIDPELHAPLLERHRQTYGEAASPAIYVCRSERSFKIPVTYATRSVLQREVGGGLLALADPSPPTARLLAGHGELGTGGGLGDCDGMLRALDLAGFRTHVGGSEPLDPASVVIIAGAMSPLGGPMTQAIEQHLVDGGALLICVDDRCPADLAAVLRRRGLMVGVGVPKGLISGDASVLFADAPEPARPQVVVSRARHMVLQEAEFPYYNLLIDSELMAPNHPATATLASGNRTLLSPWTTPVLRLDFDPERDGELLKQLAAAGRLPPFSQAPVPLLMAAPSDAWLTAREEPPKVPAHLDQIPPLTLAIAANYLPDPRSARAGEGARIVVWGSRAAVSNAVLGQAQFANADFVVDLARWLANRGKANPIPPSETVMYQVVASDNALWGITAVLVAIVPVLAIGAAILAWLHRR